nr:MAG TPA: intron associated endonuclease [Caudoviricetes sp.]
MKHVIYKITNTLNNKIYIGAHSTEDINDSYMGSGIAIKKAQKKYGIEHFTKEILHVFDTREEMYEKEREIVDLEFINRPDTYNAGIGGKGAPMALIGWSDEQRKLISENTSKAMQTPEMRERMSKAHTGKKQSEESNRKRSETIKAMYKGSAFDRTGSKLTDAHKAKISRSVSIDGVVYASGSDAAKALGLSRSGLDYRLKSDKFPEWKFVA